MTCLINLSRPLFFLHSMVTITVSFIVAPPHSSASPLCRPKTQSPLLWQCGCFDGQGGGLLRCRHRFCKSLFNSLNEQSHSITLGFGQDDDADPATNSNDENVISTGNGVASASTKWSARFIPTEPISPFLWKAPQNLDRITPAELSDNCCDLLVSNTYIDKSAALVELLRDVFNYETNDFKSVPLLVAYPRRFAKTTLLGLIKAAFSPVPNLEGYDADRVKTKIAALEKGKELLGFGMHPVLSLDLQDIESVKALNDDIDLQLKRSGLNNFACAEGTSPSLRVKKGVIMLNEKFKEETGVRSKTIILVDEYDNAFRRIERETNDPLLAELTSLFNLGKKSESGISLMVLCGLTRMVGTGLSSLNNIVDVSRRTIYHGLCGISSRELRSCGGKQLDNAASKKYNQSLASLLDTKFRKQWNGFRFGLDAKVGVLDPNSADGTLFSPIDVWEIVQWLLDVNKKAPSPQWIDSMHSEYEFMNFSDKYTSSQEGFIELFQNLLGGWSTTSTLKKKMTREDYMKLDSNEDAQKVFFELGLLSVKEIHDDRVRLYSPNLMVSRNAMDLLVKKTKRAETPESIANEYLSEVGLRSIISGAAKLITSTYAQTEEEILREFPLQNFLYLLMSCYFPQVTGQDPSYRLYHETTLCRTEESNKKIGRCDLAILLCYANRPKSVYIFKFKVQKISADDDLAIQHKKNIKIATKQFLTYIWPDQAPSLNRVAVSGIWHSAMEAGSYVLSTSSELVSGAINATWHDS